MRLRGNTEGSPGICMQTRELLEYKKQLTLSQLQTSVLAGSLLGDGTLRLGKRAINVNFKVEHGLKQKEYVFWKYEVFKEWVTTGPKISMRYNEKRLPYSKSWWFRTVRHPEITLFHKKFYPDGIKIIPKDIEDFLDPLAFAVWIMDDGSLNKDRIDISTYSFKLKEIWLLQKAIFNRFSLESNYYKDRNKGLRMYFRKNETQKLVRVISKFIIPNLRYKIPVTP